MSEKQKPNDLFDAPNMLVQSDGMSRTDSALDLE
jgi:hypothetical protein